MRALLPRAKLVVSLTAAALTTGYGLDLSTLELGNAAGCGRPAVTCAIDAIGAPMAGAQTQPPAESTTSTTSTSGAVEATAPAAVPADRSGTNRVIAGIFLIVVSVAFAVWFNVRRVRLRTRR